MFNDFFVFQVVLIAKEMNNDIEVYNHAERACLLYQQHGSPESGAAVLDKAARILETSDPSKALSLYQHAVEVVLVCYFFYT